jgi:hypothetical protein
LQEAEKAQKGAEFFLKTNENFNPYHEQYLQLLEKKFPNNTPLQEERYKQFKDKADLAHGSLLVAEHYKLEGPNNRDEKKIASELDQRAKKAEEVVKKMIEALEKSEIDISFPSSESINNQSHENLTSHQLNENPSNNGIPTSSSSNNRSSNINNLSSQETQTSSSRKSSSGSIRPKSNLNFLNSDSENQTLFRSKRSAEPGRTRRDNLDSSLNNRSKANNSSKLRTIAKKYHFGDINHIGDINYHIGDIYYGASSNKNSEISTPATKKDYINQSSQTEEGRSTPIKKKNNLKNNSNSYDADSETDQQSFSTKRQKIKNTFNQNNIINKKSVTKKDLNLIINSKLNKNTKQQDSNLPLDIKNFIFENQNDDIINNNNSNFYSQNHNDFPIRNNSSSSRNIKIMEDNKIIHNNYNNISISPRQNVITADPSSNNIFNNQQSENNLILKNENDHIIINNTITLQSKDNLIEENALISDSEIQSNADDDYYNNLSSTSVPENLKIYSADKNKNEETKLKLNNTNTKTDNSIDHNNLTIYLLNQPNLDNWKKLYTFSLIIKFYNDLKSINLTNRNLTLAKKRDEAQQKLNKFIEDLNEESGKSPKNQKEILKLTEKTKAQECNIEAINKLQELFKNYENQEALQEEIKKLEDDDAIKKLQQEIDQQKNQ